MLAKPDILKSTVYCQQWQTYESMFSFLRRLTTWPCPQSAAARSCGAVAAGRRPLAVQQSIDISCPPGPQQQIRRRSIGWDRQTDRRTPDRCIDPAPHTMLASANKVFKTASK